MATKKNREQWLEQAVRALRPLFKKHDIELPQDVRVSVGWPGGRGKKDSVIGQCWAKAAAKDKVHQIYLSPVLDDEATVLHVLVHELIHAVDDCNGHRANFGRMARAMGLEGKLTATTAGPELAAELKKVAAKLGPWPHAALTGLTASRLPKQTTRMLKTECPECGYVARTTRKWLESAGAPICPTDMVRLEVAA